MTRSIVTLPCQALRWLLRLDQPVPSRTDQELPARVVALRAPKEELFVGLDPGEAEHLQAQDPAWRVNGRRGVVQFNKHDG